MLLGMEVFPEGPSENADKGSKLSQQADGVLLRQRLVVFLFCWSVMGIIWSWTAVILIVRQHVLVAGAVVCYLTYAWTVGFKAAESMSWPPLLRRWSIWNHMRDYFSVKLHKLSDISPEKTYLFTMVPHGITAVSGWVNFATEATGFSEKFPGINLRALTLDANFLAPVIREYCLLHGLRSAGRRSITSILSSGPGSAVLLVPGGAAEAFLAAPGTCDLISAKRKGFVRMAIETGASLVPVVAFGENDIFETFIPEKGSLPDKALKLLKKCTGLATPIFWGVGFTGDWGILPKGMPLNTVVGAPIDVPKYQPKSRNDEVMAALVDEYHSKFLAAVQKIWDDHKDKYAANRRRELRFVE